MTSASGAPGAPGTSPHWASGKKSGFGTALNAQSNLWFTIGRGVVNEIFYPTVDTACTRDLKLLIADRQTFFSEEGSDTETKVSSFAAGVPAYRVRSTCRQGRYQLEKRILSDSFRPTLLQQVCFRPLRGRLQDFVACVLLNPMLENDGSQNDAWVGNYKGRPMLFAKRGESTIAMACSTGWVKRSVGYVGVSDGWQDVSRHHQMEWEYEQAECGNVALTGEIDLGGCNGEFLLALGFGRDEADAGHRAHASLLQGWEIAEESYYTAWSQWQGGVTPLASDGEHSELVYRTSAAVMRAHESKRFSGGIIASLATPWGESSEGKTRGYHLVWLRDMIETIGGLLAIERHEDARRVLSYCRATQELDGHWPQNMLTNGRPYWNGIQLDEISMVILLIALAAQEEGLNEKQLKSFWPMARQAAQYLVLNGPTTPLDRWEEESGYFASTMAFEIAALVAAADLADIHEESEVATYLRQTADTWNSMLDRMLYVTDTELAREVGVQGYYVRYALPNQLLSDSAAQGEVTLKNHAAEEGRHALSEIVSPDALCLDRLGVRAADDPKILNTVRVIDHVLKVETPQGPGWHRYRDDGYGEHENGSPYNGTGIGRLWPVLTGERAHYELAAGNRDRAVQLLKTLEASASETGLLPEQIWDADDIPQNDLQIGRPTGSAMPLVWAHAEYVKLRRSLRDGRVFDMPASVAKRYAKRRTESSSVFWRFDQQSRFLPQGKQLRVEVRTQAKVVWTSDEWQTVHETQTSDSGLGIFFADLPTQHLDCNSAIDLTFFWIDATHWEGTNFRVIVR